MLTWIVRSTAAAVLILATVTVVSAQDTGTITGTVVAEGSQQPVIGAQVHIPGSDIGTLTNDAGHYRLTNVPAGQVTVRVQSLGYGAAEQVVTVTASGSLVADFEVAEEAIALDEVVVTALGIERQERSLGYAVQSVNAERLEEVPTVNVIQALQGQSAGVRVNTASSRPGAANRIVIRGESSFTGGGQPLWVIDGVPIRMDTDEQEGLYTDDDNPLETGQAGNRGMDIDPNSIESINVLRGAAASALYGSRAAHGVIVVTTKKGTPGSPARFTFSSEMMSSQALFHGKQTNYTAGYDDDAGIPRYCNGLPADQGGWCEPGYPRSDPTTGNNWGPHKDSLSAEVLAHEGGPVRMVDPRRDFYRTGLSSETSLGVSGGLSGGGSYNLGASYTNQEGIAPGTGLDRLNLNANVSLQLNDRLRTTTMVMVSNTDNAYNNEGWEGAARDLVLNVAANRDIRPAWICNGEEVVEDTCGDNNPVMLFGSNSPHYKWRAVNEYRGSRTMRWIASQTVRYDILPNLSIQNRLGMDTYNDVRSQFQAERPWETLDGDDSGGAYSARERRFELNNDLMLNLSSTPIGNGITVNGLLGANINMQEDDDLEGAGYTIVIPDVYNVDNFETQTVGETLTRKQRLAGIYGQLTADYSDWAFLTLTGRNDWSSTLPTHNNNYFYPSASLGIIFTDALNIATPWLDYGKLRLSVAKVGSDAPPYRLTTTYDQGGGIEWPYKDQLGFQEGNRLGNPELKPESTREYEIGLDLRGLAGRARLDVSYYDKRSYDQIFEVPVSRSTGYDEITRNAGAMRNRGLEVSLDAVPIQTADFRWNLRFNFAKNHSSVLELAPGVESIELAGYSWPQVRIMEGEEYGVIWGYGYERDENGNPLIYGPSAADDGDAREPVSGEPTTPGYQVWDDELKVIGHSQPDWTGSLYSALHYGPFDLSALFTTRQGGDILNFDLNYSINNGSSSFTGVRGDEYVYEGINADTGEPNDQVVIRDREFYQNYGAYNHHENFIEDGSFIRLHSVSFAYTLPQSVVNRLGMASLQLYAQGSNLKLWTDYSYGDPQGSNYGSTNAGGNAFQFFLPPPARTYSIGLRANF